MMYSWYGEETVKLIHSSSSKHSVIGNILLQRKSYMEKQNHRDKTKEDFAATTTTNSPSLSVTINSLSLLCFVPLTIPHILTLL